jgi:predicted dehydrogenase
MNFANKAIGEYGHQPVPTYKDDDFDKMILETKPDYVIVTTVDKFHHKYCIRALELGANAVVEKPMTIDAPKLQAMIDVVKKTGLQIRVAFNYRYSPHNTVMRELVANGTIGDVTQVHFEWLLDTHHGSDFFRRWHRMKENSGGLLMCKSVHHFDLVTFWLASVPELVYCLGDLLFYGPENAKKRGIPVFERTYATENAKTDPFALHLDQSEQLKSMYLEAEKEDGYIRDRSVWSEGITIEDTLSMIVRYENKVTMTYTTNAYSPYEGFRVCLTGTKGRIELVVVEDKYVPGNEREAYGLGVNDPHDDPNNPLYVQGGIIDKKITVFPILDKPYDVEIPFGVGGHGGGDPLLLSDLLEERKPDRYNRAAFIREGAMSTLIGIAGNKSIETGMPVKVADLVHF